MAIAWTEALAVGDATIDADHRRMVELINELEDAAAALPVDCRRAGRALDGLRSFTADHFAREEALQQAVGLPDRDAHADKHRMLLQRLDALADHFSRSDDEVRAGMVRGLADPLATWLAEHIANSDVELRAYIRR
ncbi:MAG: bacteriohemerythrin [Actinomycetota bacterium]